jgi:hypothetical protein
VSDHPLVERAEESMSTRSSKACFGRRGLLRPLARGRSLGGRCFRDDTRLVRTGDRDGHPLAFGDRWLRYRSRAGAIGCGHDRGCLVGVALDRSDRRRPTALVGPRRDACLRPARRDRRFCGAEGLLRCAEAAPRHHAPLDLSTLAGLVLRPLLTDGFRSGHGRGGELIGDDARSDSSSAMRERRSLISVSAAFTSRLATAVARSFTCATASASRLASSAAVTRALIELSSKIRATALKIRAR